MIYVCNLEEMPGHAKALRPSHLVSLVERALQPDTPRDFAAARHLRVEIHDITEPYRDQVLPSEAHLRSLLEFVEGWRGDEPLLVHCVAGISRSMAAALITLAARYPGEEEIVAKRMRELAPHAHPNRRMIALADELLGCRGRLVAAREAMGDSEPLTAGPLVRLVYP